jgi:hypothetical protein
MNSFKPLLRLNLILLLALSAAACAPKFYKRTTVALETGDDEGVQVHYGELDSCLIKQQVPNEYIIRRPRYTLQIRPVPGLNEKPSIELRLQAGSAPSLRFDDVAEQPPALYAETGVRYLVETKALKKSLSFSVLRGDEELGHESFALSPDHCRVLSP